MYKKSHFWWGVVLMGIVRRTIKKEDCIFQLPNPSKIEGP